jgi:diguanylate cyclase
MLFSEHWQRYRQAHWTVRMNYRNRVVGFPFAAAMAWAHLRFEPVHPLLWVLLFICFLVVPHLEFARASASEHPPQAEIDHFKLDAVMFGFWSAILHFPPMVTLALALPAVLNPIYFRGARGLVDGVMAYGVGIVLAWPVTGWVIEHHHDDMAEGLALFALVGYLIFAAIDGYRRAMRLKETQRDLQASQQRLQEQFNKLQRLHLQVQEQAQRDPLTGVPNRYFLNEAMGTEIARHLRQGKHLVLMVLDLDHFKNINDTLGHQAGDDVLTGFAALLKRRFRASDLISRYGGEEFVVVLTDTDVQESESVAAGFVKQVAESTFTSSAGPVAVTVSVGLSVLPEHGKTFGELFFMADQALYQAKREGRNRVCVATGSPPGH